MTFTTSKKLPERFSIFSTANGEVLSTDARTTDPKLACRSLEESGIIFFPESPFVLSPDQQKFLLQQKQDGASIHKNIAYKPAEDRISGAGSMRPENVETLRSILSVFSQQARELLTKFLVPYTRGWKIDFASFRPVEEQGRKMRLRARNDLLHVDSFPTRPVFGNRILRVFHNLNPTASRIWYTSDPFYKLTATFKDQMSPRRKLYSHIFNALPGFTDFAKMAGITVSDSSPYDRWMMNFHNFLKENSDFQANARKCRWEFPPNSAWIVFTDCVSHAALSGQYALEQTFIISQNDLVAPELAPINVLSKMYPGSGIDSACAPGNRQLVGAVRGQ